MSNIFLSNISFPVFLLGKEKPTTEEGESYYLKVDERGLIPKEMKLVVDNKNIKGHNLASRRLQLRLNNVKLFNIKSAIFFIADLVKLTHGNTWFIDSTGKIFNYKKTRVVPLLFKKIDKVIPMPTGGAIIEIDGIRHKTLFLPKYEHKYAGVLKVDGYYILYGTYDEKLKDTTRKI